MHYFHYNKLKEKGGGEDAKKATLKLCEAW